MATYYGYAERDANSYVDWGKLGQNLTDTVQAAYKIREDKKAALDKAMQDNYAELANSPTGENQDINGAVTGFADNSKQYLLQVNKLLKAGVLKPKDYTLIMQNIQEDTKSLFDNAKNWQDAYAKILERNKNSTGSKAELDLASDVAAFGKFKNLNLMINPTTGRVSGAQMTKGPNGELIKGDTKSMQQLNVLMNQPIDKYQLTDKLSGLQEKLGENQISKFRAARIQANGQITEIQDKQLKASFDAAKNGFINEVMANPFNVMSILTDYQGVIPGTTDAYKVSTNPADRGKPNVIMYVDPDGDGSYTPEFSPAQRKAAEQFATDQFLGLIDHKEANQAIGEISQTSAASFERLDQLGRTDMFGQQVGYLLSGTPEQKLAAASFFNGLKNADGTNVGGQEIRVDKNGKVTYIDENGVVDKYNIANLDKAQAGNQFFSMYAAPFKLDAKRYQKQVLNTGGKDVTIPKADIESSKSKAATTNTDAGATEGGMNKYNKAK
jgi:hypothetical protein